MSHNLLTSLTYFSPACPLLTPLQHPVFLAAPPTHQAPCALAISSVGTPPLSLLRSSLGCHHIRQTISDHLYQVETTSPDTCSFTLPFFPSLQSWSLGQFWQRSVSDFPKHIMWLLFLTCWRWVQPRTQLSPALCEGEGRVWLSGGSQCGVHCSVSSLSCRHRPCSTWGFSRQPGPQSEGAWAEPPAGLQRTERVVVLQSLSCVWLFGTSGLQHARLPVLQYLLEFIQTYVPWVGDEHTV